MSARRISDPAVFIRANTKILSPPLIPEVRLHLAEESLTIWSKTEEELGASGLPPPYWAFAWAGGQALGRYLLDNPVQVAGKPVLDLAAGCGLTAIAALKAGAASAIGNDIDDFAGAAMTLNAGLNDVAIEVQLGDMLSGPAPAGHVILVGDLFYEKPLAERVLAWLYVCQKAGAVILTGDPQRTYFPKERFSQIAEYHVPVSRELEDAEIKKTAVWRLNPVSGPYVS
jgi:predicted nicotinamide N-methyase